MSSYEDRMRTFAFYIKLGKCLCEANRKLGYPTKNALASQHQNRWRDSLSSAAKAATVRFLNSLAARNTRMAISPRFAIRIFSKGFI